MIDKERKLKDIEKLYMNLRDILSKQPNLQITTKLNKVQKQFRKRGEKIKVSIEIYKKDFGNLKILTNQNIAEMKYAYLIT